MTVAAYGFTVLCLDKILAAKLPFNFKWIPCQIKPCVSLAIIAAWGLPNFSESKIWEVLHGNEKFMSLLTDPFRLSQTALLLTTRLNLKAAVIDRLSKYWANCLLPLIHLLRTWVVKFLSRGNVGNGKFNTIFLPC